MSKLRNVRYRQWERNLRHHMALTRRSNPLLAGRSNPLLVVDEVGSYLGWPLVLPKGYNRMTQRLERRLWANYRSRIRRGGTDAQAAG